MPRASTKNELITSATDQWDKLWKLIDTIPGGVQSVVFDFGDDPGCMGEQDADRPTSPKLKEAHWKRDKNLRDVLIHLYEWHQLLLVWADANMSGMTKPFLPEPYNWKTYGDMNVGFWEKHQSTTYDDAVTMLRVSHDKVIALVERFNDTELFEKKHFPWTGTSSLGSYCVSATASHYDWAMKKIKQYLKRNGVN